MSEIDPIILQLTIDGKEQYKADLRDVTSVVDRETGKQARAVDNLERRTTGAMQRIGGAFAALGKAGILTGSSMGALALGVAAFVTKAVEFASKIEKTSKALGITTQAFQELRFAQMQLGQDQEGLERGLDELTKKLQKAALGADAPSKLFRALGVDIKNAKGEIQNAAVILPTLADRVNAIEDPMRRAAIRAELFGDAAQHMTKLLNQGLSGISEFAQRAHELGAVLTDDEIQRLIRAGEAVKRLRAQLEVRMTRVVGENAAAIEGLAAAFASLAEKALGAISVMQRWNAIRILRNGIGTDEDRAGAIGVLSGSPQARREAFETVRERRRLKREQALANGDAAAATEADRQAAADYKRILAASGRQGASPPSIDPTEPNVSGLLAPNPRKSRTPRKRSGPTAEEIEQKHLEELRRLYADQLQDELAITTDIERRREIQNELNRLEYEQRRAQIENDKNFTKAQKAAQLVALNKRFGGDAKLVDGEYVVGTPSFLGQAVNREYEERAARNRAQAARDEGAALQAEAELVDTRIARLAIERAILEQREIEERAALDAAIASGQIADAVKARAALEREQAARRTKLNRDFESPLQASARRYRNQGENIDDEVEALVVQRLDEVDDAITDAISSRLGVKDPLLKSLLNLFIQQALIAPITEALAAASKSGGGGGFLSFLTTAAGALFGRASGGYVGPGQTVRVNENRGGVELLRMGSQGGKVIPLGQANARAARSGGVTKVFNINVSADNSVTPAAFAQGLARDILQQAAAMDAQTGRAVLRAVPQRLTQFQIDGT